MPTRSQIEALLGQLSTAPTRISDIARGWTDGQMRVRLAEEQWSAAQILAHIRASDDILAYRCYLILAYDHPNYYDLDERRWEIVVGYSQLDFAQSLQAFALRRAELVQVLKRASSEDWLRAGTHARRGEQTLWTVASYLSEHEEEHVAQLHALATHAKR